MSDTNKYLSKWTGAQIDQTYEAMSNLSFDASESNKLIYMNNNGKFSVTTFFKDDIALVTPSAWESGAVNNFLIKDSNEKISPSTYNFYSFISYRNSPGVSDPAGYIPYFYTSGNGSEVKYYLTSTNITPTQVSTAFSDIEDLKEAVGSETGGPLSSRVAKLELDVASLVSAISTLTSRISALENEVGTIQNQYVYIEDEGEHAEVMVSGNNIIFVNDDIETSGNNITITTSGTYLSGNEIHL